MREVGKEGGRPGEGGRGCLFPTVLNDGILQSYNHRKAGMTTNASRLEKVGGKRRAQAGCHRGADGPILGCPPVLCVRDTKKGDRPLSVRASVG